MSEPTTEELEREAFEKLTELVALYGRLERKVPYGQDPIPTAMRLITEGLRDLLISRNVLGLGYMTGAIISGEKLGFRRRG